MNRACPRRLLAPLAPAAAANGVPVLAIDSAPNDSLNGDYTTSNFFVNELDSDSIPPTEKFSPDAANVTGVGIFTEPNRRFRAALRANGDSI